VANRWILAVVFIVCAIAGYFIARSMRLAYRAVVLLMPLESVPHEFLGRLVGQTALSRLGMTPPVNKGEPIALVKSHSLLATFMVRDKVIPVPCADSGPGARPGCHRGDLDFGQRGAWC